MKRIAGIALAIFLTTIPAQAGLLESVEGRQFIVVGVSTATVPVFVDVFRFETDGAFVMHKLESYGDGSFYEQRDGVFYCLFTASGVDIQYVEAFGAALRSLAGGVIAGQGFFMIDYGLEPFLFCGIEVFQPGTVATVR